MAKRLKLKLSRVIPSTFHLCRPKRSSALPEPAFYLLSPVNPKRFDIGFPNLPSPPPSTPEHRFRKLSSKAVSVGCGGCRSMKCFTESDDIQMSPGHSWKNRDSARWSRVYGGREAGSDRKVNCNASFHDGNKIGRRRVSVSSRDSGCFSSEEEDEDDDDDETETLISGSRSFSDEYSEMERSSDCFFNEKKPKKIKKVNTNLKKIRRLRRYGSIKSTEEESPIRTSVLSRKTVPSAVEGKVRESIAVVKKSADPYDDFKQSMWEMILEKQMFEAKDLEQLLQCFLSLNSTQYHSTIVKAFSDVWEVLCDFPVKGSNLKA